MDWWQALALVVGSSGITGIFVEAMRRRDERTKYWLRERQELYEKIMHTRNLIEDVLDTMLMELETGCDPRERWETELTAQQYFTELVKLSASVKLLGGNETRDAVDQYVYACLDNVSANAANMSMSKVLTKEAGQTMESAFRRELRIDT